MKWLTVVFLSTLSCGYGYGSFVTVDAYAKKCFSNTSVEAGTKMVLTFELAEKEFSDIYVKIVAPGGRVMYDGEQESSGEFKFAAHEPGNYTYCFSNENGTTPKNVMFKMVIGDTPESIAAWELKKKAKLDELIKELNTS